MVNGLAGIGPSQSAEHTALVAPILTKAASLKEAKSAKGRKNSGDKVML